MFDVCCCLQLTDVGRVTISVTPMPFVTTQPKRIAAGANKVSMATERSVSVSVVSMVILFERPETSSNVPNDLLVSFLEQNNLGYATCRTACGHGFDTFWSKNNRDKSLGAFRQWFWTSVHADRLQHRSPWTHLYDDLMATEPSTATWRFRNSVQQNQRCQLLYSVMTTARTTDGPTLISIA